MSIWNPITCMQLDNHTTYRAKRSNSYLFISPNRKYVVAIKDRPNKVRRFFRCCQSIRPVCTTLNTETGIQTEKEIEYPDTYEPTGSFYCSGYFRNENHFHFRVGDQPEIEMTIKTDSGYVNSRIPREKDRNSHVDYLSLAYSDNWTFRKSTDFDKKVVVGNRTTMGMVEIEHKKPVINTYFSPDTVLTRLIKDSVTVLTDLNPR